MTTLWVILAMWGLAVPAAAGEWRRLPPLPDTRGVAGCFAGVSHGVLLVAGGANFPEKMPWEGGRKVWHDRVYALASPEGDWREVGRLPRPLGYGVSVTHGESVICAGGSDATGHYADVFRLEWVDGEVVASPLPALPRAVANACGAMVGDVLYLAGGQERPDSVRTLRSVYCLDLGVASPAWREVGPLPGPGRMLAVAAALDGAFWVAGGVDLEEVDGKPQRRYLRDACRLESERGWTRVADLPWPAVAAPSPAPSLGKSFYVLGGDDGSKVGLQPPETHPGFNRTVLRFDQATGGWTDAGTLPAAHVTTPLVAWHGNWIMPSGEVRPGVRSPEVWCFQPEKVQQE